MDKNPRCKYAVSAIKFTLSFLFCCLLMIGLDQWTKSLAVKYLKGESDITIIPNVFSLSYVENHGAAFGILQGRQWLLIGISIFFLILILFFVLHLFHIMQSTDRSRASIGKYYFLIVCMAMITAGAIGNLIDRMRQGYVVDFFYLLTKNIPVLSFDFPVFNVADCFVTFAAFSVIITGLFFFNEEEMNRIFSFRTRKKDSE